MMSKPAVKSALEEMALPTPPEEVPTTLAGEEMLNEDNISTLAYQLWEERGRPDGDPELDWYEAERQLRMRNGAR
jgi:hypothetical protein